MRDIYFGDFRQFVLLHYREIAAENPEYQSTEWFLLKYLKRIEKNSTPPASAGSVESSMRGFVRFYVDMIEENTPLADRCIKIYEQYRKTLRSSQESS